MLAASSSDLMQTANSGRVSTLRVLLRLALVSQVKEPNGIRWVTRTISFIQLARMLLTLAMNALFHLVPRSYLSVDRKILLLLH